ncbi:MAG: hypothetical protein D6160_18885 [Ketobacter sp.]|nr:MAG: hypothetical protein D6160_18885 [Ketobacter sp.]
MQLFHHFLVVLPEYSENRVPTKPEQVLSSLFSISEPWCALQQHEDDDDYESNWHQQKKEIVSRSSTMNGCRRTLRTSKYIKRMLSDWFSAALQISF